MSLTSYAQQKLLDHLLGKSSFTMPTGCYLALFNDDPGEAGDQGGEVAGGSYARVDLSTSLSDTDAVTGKSVNTATITFAIPTADWGVISHAAVMDAASAGNMIFIAPFSVARILNSGDSPVEFLQGQLEVRLY